VSCGSVSLRARVVLEVCVMQVYLCLVLLEVLTCDISTLFSTCVRVALRVCVCVCVCRVIEVHVMKCVCVL